MIEETKEQSKEMELALKAVEQAKARLAKAKSKESERLRREDAHKKIVMGGIVKKYFPDCYYFNEVEINKILSTAIASADCKSEIEKIKSQSAGNSICQKPLMDVSSDQE